MKLAALFSGGKDSTYAIQVAERLGYQVEYLLTINPASDESYFFHYPNIWITRLQAEAMGKRHLLSSAKSPSKADELQALMSLVDRVSGEIDGLLSGVTRSRAQYDAFRKFCAEKGLELVAPLWGLDPIKLLEEMISEGLVIMIVGVAAEGLGRDLLGRILDEDVVLLLKNLSKRYNVNPLGEGGEFETLVIDAPFFKKRLKIIEYEVSWDGYSGLLRIKDAVLIKK